jgi:citrate synthase
MLEGEEPDADRARALEQYWISTIDHGFNTSTFTARVIASTRADVGAAIVGALGALSGPLHGGAPGRVWEMLDEIGTPERADEWLRAKLERGERIMGFGHAVYRTEDPRSRLLREVAERLGGPRVELARHVEERSLALLRELRPGHELYTNVEFYASIVLEAVGLPPDLFTPTFALSRMVGWSAHILEQLKDPRIMRPAAQYVGPPPPVPVPDLE